MPTPEQQPQDAYGPMDARRLELGLTWRQVADRAGISYETIRQLRAGKHVRALTARKLDGALQWAPGTVWEMMHGSHANPAQPQNSGLATYRGATYPVDPGERVEDVAATFGRFLTGEEPAP